MPALSQQFLQQLGIELDEQTYQVFAEHVETTLEERVIESIVDNLNQPQLDELANLKGQNDEQLQTWLQTNVPELTEIIQDEIDILLGDLAENSESI